MESQDPRNAVNKLIRILKKGTRLVQIAPFVYLLFYGIYMIISLFASEEFLCFADSLFVARPVTIMGMLVASRLFELCIWHKAACLIPGISQVENYIDNYVITFTQEEVMAINLIIGLLSLLFLVKAHRHFFYGRERTDKSNARVLQVQDKQ